MTRPACDKFAIGDRVAWWHPAYRQAGIGTVTGWHYTCGQRVYHVTWSDGSDVMGRGWQFEEVSIPADSMTYRGVRRGWQVAS